MRALTLPLMLLAITASTPTQAASVSHERLSPKTQWAPSGNLSALHVRAVFRGKSTCASRPCTPARGELAAGSGLWLTKDGVGAESYLATPNSIGPWSYASLGPSRYVDIDGRAPMDQLSGQESRNQSTAAEVNNRAAAGDSVAQGIQRGAFVTAGLMASPLVAACAMPVGAPICKGLGYAALAGVFTSGQPTVRGVEEQVNACVAPRAPTDGMVCGFGVGATALGAGQLASRVVPQARAAVASVMLEAAPMSVAEGELVSIGERALAPAPRPPPVSAPAAVPATAKQPTLSWADAAAAAQRNSQRIAPPLARPPLASYFDPLPAVRPRHSVPSTSAEGLRSVSVGLDVEPNTAYIYAVSDAGELLLAPRGNPVTGQKHTQMTGGGAARAAGEIMRTDQGVLLINTRSGRYMRQSSEAIDAVRKALRALGEDPQVVDQEL